MLREAIRGVNFARRLTLHTDPYRVEAVEQQLVRLVFAKRADRSEGEIIEAAQAVTPVRSDQPPELVNPVLMVEEILVVDVNRASERIDRPVAQHALVEAAFVENLEEAPLRVKAGGAKRATLDAAQSGE